jgi:hypothetical protein
MSIRSLTDFIEQSLGRSGVADTDTVTGRGTPKTDALAWIHRFGRGASTRKAS